MRLTNAGFVGGGRIVSILLTGWERTGTLPPHVVVCDVDAAVLSRLESKHPAIEACGAHAAKPAAQ